MANVLRFSVIGAGDASDLDRLAAAVDRITDQIRDLDRQRANPEIDVDTRKAQTQVGKFARDMQRTITRAIESLPDIDLDADASEAQREIQQIRAALVELNDKRVGIDIGAEEAQREVAALQARLERLSRSDVDVQVQADTAAALAQLKAVTGEVDKLDGRTATVKLKTDGRFGDAVIQVAALGRALSTLAIPAALAAATPAIAGLGAAAMDAAGSVALLPAAAAAAGAAFAALKVGLSGVGDALKARDDAEMFAEALKKLSPAAAEFVTKVRDLGPAWKTVQLDVQQRLFAGLATELGKLSGAYLPKVQSALGGIADGFNRAAKETGKFLSSEPTVKRLGPALDSIRDAVSNAAQSIRPLTSAFVTLIEEGSSRLPRLGKSIADVSKRFDEWLKKAQTSGDLGRWIDQGIAAIEQLGRIAGNVGGILGGLFDAADASGVSFLDTVERITAGIKEFLNSAQGQTTLTSLFTSIREGIDAALPGLKELALAVADVITQLSDAGVLQAAGAALSSIASGAAPVVTQLGNLATAVLPPLLSLIEQLGPALVPVATGILGLRAAASVGGAIQGLTGKVKGFHTELGKSEGSAGKFRTVIGGLATFLGAGGPWGLAIGAAITAVGLLAQAWADSEADAKKQQDAIDALAESLDRYTGAATEATLAQRAQEVGTKTLSDGQTTYATALGKAGVSTRDFVQATTGNAQALQKVRGQLDASVQSLIAASPQYQSTREKWDAMGVSLADLAAAAQGNGPALDKVNDAITRSSAGAPEAATDMQLLAGSLDNIGGTSAEMGKELNRLAGEFETASQRARDMGLASLSFGENLESIKPGLEGLANGGKITQELADRFVGLSESAGIAAKSAGDAAAALTGVDGGAAAAKKSMEESRDAFISAAEAAGIARPEAEELARQIGLIPEAAETIFRTNAAGVAAEMITLNTRIQQIPAGKSIVVKDLSAEARANLESLGFQIEAIPGTKDVKVTAPTDDARAQLDQFVAFANGAHIMMTGDMNVDPATQKIQQTVTLGNGQTATLTYDADASRADGKIHATVDLGNGQTAALTYDAVPDPATGKIKAVVEYGNGQRTELLIDPNDQVTPTLDQLLHPETIPVDIKVGQNDVPPAKTEASTPVEAPVNLVPETSAVPPAKTEASTPVEAPVNLTPNTAPVPPAKTEASTPVDAPVNLTPDSSAVPPAKTEAGAPVQAPVTFTVDDSAVTTAKQNAAQPTTSTHTITADTSAVDSAKSGLGAGTSSTHTINVTNNVPAAKSANAAATSSMHTINVTDNVPAAKTAAQQPTQSLHTLNCDDKAVLDAKKRAEQPTSSLHTINCDDRAVRDAKSRAQQATSSTHTIHVRTVGAAVPRAAGAYATPRAKGAYAQPAYMASGGLRRMSSARAEIVPPRQPRVIGDRMRGDEAFIPINRSPRSISILQTAAQRMGFGLVPGMADGGVRAMPHWSTSTGSSGDALVRELRGLAEELRAAASGKDVTITNNFAIANASQAADEVARTQRVAAATGIFG